MRKINLVVKTLGVSTIMLASCIIPTVAQTVSEDLQQLQPSSDFLERPSVPEEVEIDINQPITLEEAIQLAVRNNKDLQEAKLNLERAEKELQEARAALFPTVDFDLDYRNAESAASSRADERLRQRNPGFSDERLGIDGSTNTFDGEVVLGFDIYTGGNRGANIRRAKRQLEVNSLDVARVTEQILFETGRDYYDLQNSDAQVEIEEAAVEDANQTLTDAQLLERAGLGTRFDVLRAEVELANAQQRLTRAMATQKTARRQLATTLSVAQEVNLRTADKIETAGVWDKSLEESIILGYQNRVELEQLLARRELNKAQKQIALSAIRPQISFFALYDFLEVTDDNIGISDGYAVGARLRWALFDGGRALARARQSDKAIEIDEVNFANQRNDIRLQVEQAFFDLQANKNNIATAQQAEELAEESLRLARLRFQAGVGTQTEVIASQTELTTARGNLLRAIIDYNQSLNQLQRAVNGIADLRLSTVDQQTVNSQ